MSSPYFYYALPLLLNLPVERKCRDSCWWSRCYCFCYCYRMRPQQPLSSRCLSSPGDRRFCRRRRLRRFLFTFELLSLFLRLSRKKRSFLPRATNNKERTQPRWQWLQFFFKFVAKSPALSTEQTDQWHTFVHSLSHLLFSIRDNFRFDSRPTDRPSQHSQTSSSQDDVMFFDGDASVVGFRMGCGEVSTKATELLHTAHTHLNEEHLH